MTDPITALHTAVDAVGKLLTDAATQHAADVATIAARDATIVDLEAQLHPEPVPAASRFPGDPGPDKLILGAATSGGNVARVQLHEKAAGRPLGVRRRYWNNGVADIAVPGGPLPKGVLEDQAAGRIPLVSVKLGAFAGIASGTFDTQLKALFRWLESLPKVTFFVVNHEPENDGLSAADFRAAQQHIRAVLDSVTGGKAKRVSFGGSLMAYDWAKGSGRNPDDWFPGAGVWDWCGIDQYAQTAGGPIIDSKYVASVASIKRWGVPFAVTELGIRDQDPAAGQKLKDFFARALADGAVLISYYDSVVNSTQDGWEMDDTHGQLAAFHELMKDSRVVTPNA